MPQYPRDPSQGSPALLPEDSAENPQQLSSWETREETATSGAFVWPGDDDDEDDDDADDADDDDDGDDDSLALT